MYVSRTISRVMSLNGHLSRTAVAGSLQQPTRKAWAGPAAFPIWSCSRRGMPSMPRHRGIWWALAPPFHPYPARGGAVCFLWRCPRVAPPGCYPASCPVEPGLSSPGTRPAATVCPTPVTLCCGLACRPQQNRTAAVQGIATLPCPGGCISKRPPWRRTRRSLRA